MHHFGQVREWKKLSHILLPSCIPAVYSAFSALYGAFAKYESEPHSAIYLAILQSIQPSAHCMAHWPNMRVNQTEPYIFHPAVHSFCRHFSFLFMKVLPEMDFARVSTANIHKETLFSLKNGATRWTLDPGLSIACISFFKSYHRWTLDPGLSIECLLF